MPKIVKGMKTPHNGQRTNRSAFNITDLEIGDLVIENVITTAKKGSMAYASHQAEKKQITLQNGHLDDMAELWPDVLKIKDNAFVWNGEIFKGFSISKGQIKKT